MEDLHSMILEHVQEIIYAVRANGDPLRGKVQFVGKWVESLLGYKPQEFRENPNLWISIIHPDDLENVRRSTQEMSETDKPIALFYRVRHKRSEQYIWLEDKLSPYSNNEAHFAGYIGVAREVTNRMYADRQRNLQHAIAVALAGAGNAKDIIASIIEMVCRTLSWDEGELWNVDPQLNVLKCYDLWFDPAHVLTDFVRATREITFAPGTGLPGRIWASTQPHWIADVLEDQNFPRCLAAAKGNLHSGFGFPVVAEGRVIGVACFFSKEIRQPNAGLLQMFNTIGSQIGQFIHRKQTEEALRESEERYRAVVEQATDSIFLVDAETHRIISANSSFRKLLGYSFDELQAMTLDDFIVHEKESIDRNIKLVIKKKHFVGERSYRRKDGSLVDVEVSSHYTPQEGKQILCVVLRDISERKRAEEGLKLFRMLIDRSNDIIEVVDPDTGRFLDVNEKGCLALGYSREEFLTLSVPDLDPIADPASFIRAVADLRKSGVLMWEGLHRRKDGSTFPVEVNISLTQRGREYIVSVVRDITERKQVEDALRENEKSLRDSQIVAGLGSFTLNIVSGIWKSSEIMDTIFGIDNSYTRSIEGWVSLVHPDWRDVMLGYFRDEVLAKQIRFNKEYKIIRQKDGEERWVHGIGELEFDAQHRPIKMTGTIIDITERKQAEEALRKSEEQFRLISENVADMIAVLDLEGKRIYNSPSYKPILGDPELLRGTDSFQEIHSEDREEIKHIFRETAKTGIGQRTNYRILLKDGSVLYIESQGSVIRDEHGNIARVIVVSRDVTEKRHLEKLFLRAQRMESIGTLAGGIAHDLNNVLAPIMLSLEIISRKLPDEQSQKTLQMLQSSTRRGSDLIKQILSFARGMEGEPTFIQIGHLIDDIGKIIGETFPKSISYHQDVPKNLPLISADPTHLHQVMMNLCVNARDAMPNGGRIEIQAESSMLDEQFVRTHVEAKPGLHVVITVTDQGLGMPPAIMERIYDPFFTTKEIGKGTGLGLSTVLAIVKSYGGYINVYSEVGKGTTFKVYLPAQEDAQAVGTEEKKKLRIGDGELILVVDDEASIREITKTTLEAYGYSAITAADGTEAVAAFATQGSKVALVVTDMMMPHMDGTATIRALRMLNPRVKIIAVSGLKQNEDTFNQESVVFLDKPFTAEKLLRAVGELLHQK